MRTAIALCALFALAAGVSRAADHPPVGAVVVAADNGRCYVHVGGGHFKECAPARPPAAPRNCLTCNACAAGCSCFGGGYYCCDGSCPVSFPKGGLGSGPATLGAKPVTLPLTPPAGAGVEVWTVNGVQYRVPAGQRPPLPAGWSWAPAAPTVGAPACVGPSCPTCIK